MTQRVFKLLALFTGLFLVFIGARFILAPKIAEIGYGINVNTNGDFAFHYIKGIRDLFTGLLITILFLTRQTKALALTLLVGTIIPIADCYIVLSKSYNGLVQAIPHLIAIGLCFSSGMILLLTKPPKVVQHPPYVKVIQSADTGAESIIEFNILPGERTPWHYHTLFSESFEVLKGALTVGLNDQIMRIVKGDQVTINPNQKHFFHNQSSDDCMIRVTVRPGNKNFENALLISKGLAKDGQSSASGVPKKLTDLAIFVYLNNSQLVGWQKLAAPIFNNRVKAAIRNGRLNQLLQEYATP